MPLSCLLFLVLWGFIQYYKRFVESDVKVRVTTEIDNRLRQFLEQLIHNFTEIKEKPDPDNKDNTILSPEPKLDVSQYESIRSEMKFLLEKEKKVFGAQKNIRFMDFIHRYLWVFFLMLLPAFLLVVIEKIKLIVPLENLLTANQHFLKFFCEIKKYITMGQTLADVILIFAIIIYGYKFFKVIILKDQL